MMNLTVLSLVRAASLSSSPLISAPQYRAASGISLSGLNLRHFSAPLFATSNHRLSLGLSASTFSQFLGRVAQVEALADHLVRRREDFGGQFSVEISHCAFVDIHSSLAGAAFLVSSDTHTLSITNSRFMRCETTGEVKVGQRLAPVGGGAFVFSGAKSIITKCSFLRCTASGHTQSFHSYVAPNGVNQLTDCFVTRCGRADINKHTLFALDSGNADVRSLNVTHNYVSDGYAGGIVGWFASASKIGFCLWEYNVGRSIFGSCAYGSESRGTDISSVMFLNNIATKYGVYMRHTGSTHFRRATFLNNTGHVFYGNAPLKLYRVYMDCDRPPGPIDEDSVAYNWLERHTFAIRVPKAPHRLDIPGADVGDALDPQESDVESVFENIKTRERAIDTLKHLIMGHPPNRSDANSENRLRKQLLWLTRGRNLTKVLSPEFLLPHHNRTAEYFKRALERAQNANKV